VSEITEQQLRLRLSFESEPYGTVRVDIVLERDTHTRVVYRGEKRLETYPHASPDTRRRLMADGYIEAFGQAVERYMRDGWMQDMGS
jgi:hypothetical protein